MVGTDFVFAGVFAGFWVVYFSFFGGWAFHDARYIREQTRLEEYLDRLQEEEAHYRKKASTAWWACRRRKFAKFAAEVAKEIALADERIRWLTTKEAKRASRPPGRWSPKPMLRKGVRYLVLWIPVQITDLLLWRTRPNWIEEIFGSFAVLDPLFALLMLVLALFVFVVDSDSSGPPSAPT